MILWKELLVTTVLTVVEVNGRASQQADLTTGLVKEQGELVLGKWPVTVQQNLKNGPEKEEHGDVENSWVTDTDDFDNNKLEQLNDVDDAGIQYALENSLMRKQNDLSGSMLADSDDLKNNLQEEPQILNDAEISTSTAELSKNPDNRSLLNFWETMILQNKSCTPTISCTRAGGYCFSSGSSCKGVVDAFGCIGGRCMCCIPVATSPILTTSEPVTDTTAAPSTAPSSNPTTFISTTPSDVSTTATPTTLSIGCAGGFVIQGQCFKMFTDYQRSWENARMKCLSENLILAEPSDSAAALLREYVLRNFGTGDHQCWLGGRGDGSKFIWQHSGKSLLGNSSLWDSSYPLSTSYMSSSRCIELDALQYEWQDAPDKPYDPATCTLSRWTLCEDVTTVLSSTMETSTTTVQDTTTPSDVSTTAILTTLSAGCTGGFVIQGQCFKMFTDYERSWESARMKCLSENLILAEPSDSAAAPLREYVLRNFGTGDYQSWLGARSDGSKFIWQHSGKALFSNSSLWDIYISSPIYCLELDALQSQLQLNPGKPYDAFICTYSRWTLCEDVTTVLFSTIETSTTTVQDTTRPSNVSTTAIPTTLSAGCTGGFVIQGQCFKMFTDYERSWESARMKCLSENLILAEPSDSAAAPLREYVLRNFGTGNHECWLGGRGDGGKFIWQHSGKSLLGNSSLWDDYYSSSTSKCLELDALQNEWQSAPGKPYDAVSCTYSRWTLCEDVSKENSSTIAASTTTVSDTTTTSSNLRWLMVGSDRFIRFDQKPNWTDARNLCRSHGLDLYVPKNTTAVSKYLSDNFSNGGTMWHWLGARGNGTHMVWLNGEVLTTDDPWYISSGGYYTHVGTDACLWAITNSGWVESGKGVLNTQNDSCNRSNYTYGFYVICG